MRKLRVLALGAVLAACSSAPPATQPVSAVDVAKAPPPPPMPPAPTESEGKVPIDADDAVRGPRDALVTIVLFSGIDGEEDADLMGTLDRVRGHYDRDVRIVFKHAPRGNDARAKSAAIVARGVLALRGNEAFWKFVAGTMGHRQLLTDEGLRRAAEGAGVTGAELDAGLAAKAWSDRVERDAALAKAVGADRTPSMLINGVLVLGAWSYDRVAREVDARIAQANALVAAGVPRSSIHMVATAANFKEPPLPRNEPPPKVVDQSTVWNIPATGAPARGKATALVTIVEVGDFQCPFTQRAQSTLDALRKKYGDDLRIVWRDQPLPFHGRALPAAELARSARAQKGEAAFWAVHDALFANPQKLEDNDLATVARGAGIDVSKAMAAVKNATYKAAIESDIALANGVEATGTPTFFVNGRMLRGAQPPYVFEKIIDEELVRAKAELANGTSPAALYATLIKNGKSAKPAAPDPNPAPRKPSILDTGIRQ